MLNFPIAGKHQRSPSGRSAGGGAAGAVARLPRDGGRARGAGVRLRRRRHHRSRSQRVQHGRARRAARRLRAGAATRVLPRTRPTFLASVGMVSWLAVMVGPRRDEHRARNLGHRPARDRAAGDARHPRPDRPRRGGDHRCGSCCGALRTSRPGGLRALRPTGGGCARCAEGGMTMRSSLKLFTVVGLASGTRPGHGRLAVRLARPRRPGEGGRGEGVPGRRQAGADPEGLADSRLCLPGHRERARRHRGGRVRQHPRVFGVAFGIAWLLRRRDRGGGIGAAGGDSAAKAAAWAQANGADGRRPFTRSDRSGWRHVQPSSSPGPRAKLVGLVSATLVAVSTLDRWPVWIACGCARRLRRSGRSRPLRSGVEGASSPRSLCWRRSSSHS